VPSRFLDRIDYDRLSHLPRYLKGLLIRAERAALNPAKNQDRIRQLAPYQDGIEKASGPTDKITRGAASDRNLSVDD
jgi:ATP-dependent helicase HrpA